MARSRFLSSFRRSGMADQTDSISPSRRELQQLVLEAAAVMTQPPVGHRVLWKLDPAELGVACVTVGLPRMRTCGFRDAFHRRLVWWPDGITDRRRVTILSSRIGARHDQYRWWFDLLRTAVLRINVSDECAVAVDGTAPHAATMRAAEIFGIPRLNFTVHDGVADTDQLADWLATRIDETRAGPAGADPLTWRAQVSPLLLHAALPAWPAVTDQTRRSPIKDQCAVAAGERSRVLACRPGGYIHDLLRNRLQETATAAAICYVASGPGTQEGVFDELIRLGAVPWLVAGINSASQLAGRASANATSSTVVNGGPLDRPQDWLCHWTRPCAGPWPGQSVSEYLDELLLGCETSDRSALATLLQIMAHRIVLASVIRKRHQAVSFTAVALSEFRRRRVYRRHRRRYDFEPWGIAVRRDALSDLEIQPVRYGSRDERHPEQSSGLFQPATDQSGSIDWREEQEWRLMNDLRLDVLPDAAICLFVDSPAEAEFIRQQGEWPVVVVPD